VIFGEGGEVRARIFRKKKEEGESAVSRRQRVAVFGEGGVVDEARRGLLMCNEGGFWRGWRGQ